MLSMLHPELTLVGKLKQAYSLNVQDTERLLLAIPATGLQPYALWQEIYTTYWQQEAESKAQAYSLPPLLSPAALTREMFHLNGFASTFLEYVLNLARLIHICHIEKGMQHAMQALTDDIKIPDSSDLGCFLYVLYSQENGYINQNRPGRTPKQIEMREEYSAFLYQFLPETVVINKAAAICYLEDSGYSLVRNVKGITGQVVARILAQARAVSDSGMTAPLPLQLHSTSQSPDIVRVPTALWKNKSGVAARKAMQEVVPDSIIAHVLLHWCEMDKTRVGKLLALKEYEDDKSYRNFVDRLLQKNAAITIVKA